MNFSNYLHSLTEEFTPIVEYTSKEDYIQIDLSVHQKILKEAHTLSSLWFQQFIENFVSSHNKKVAIGGYLEVRNLYNRSTYFTSTKINSRNIHLGIDIWSPAHTAVLLPLDGKIHSLQNNINHGDYGPTIIVEHEYQAQTFYSLYGHLSLTSLNGIEINSKLKAGEVLGYLGKPEENGDYAPHLHFQIIKDLEGNRGDYPGVCAAKDLEFYKSNCPDPNLLLKFK
ncbi:peptidoglycan DD-metalloendopeptidase family protein [Mesonia ostreae]|uniref:Peptidoglycan DD-metalloendopeptidase family protein n=1 Tax=Mesonia ostreae TaxID=861110 RepID=A0ABU2KEA2_9FLAO|nr:peptidoglycan DD-metalloendopeptidase family protein [Mesonia ostreae]MDT0293035.1 peptidoglycan DD-metalloendopeptidase family protein [Mesonia ostreae]